MKKTSKAKNPKITKLSNDLTKFLDKTKVKYNLLKHKVVYTAHDLAQTTKRKLSDIAKVVLVRADKDFVLIVLPAGKYLDLKGIKTALKAKKVSLATEKEIKAKLKTKIGLLHPFGSQYNVKTLLDKGMSKSKKLISSAGSYTDSFELSMKDFEKLVLPIKGAFSKKNK
jgi:prolyl-tRNA editing enzyme YbaK/EbsC (Cys-tRNA(Pro) deacylase)